MKGHLESRINCLKSLTYMSIWLKIYISIKGHAHIFFIGYVWPKTWTNNIVISTVSLFPLAYSPLYVFSKSLLNVQQYVQQQGDIFGLIEASEKNCFAFMIFNKVLSSFPSASKSMSKLLRWICMAFGDLDLRFSRSFIFLRPS